MTDASPVVNLKKAMSKLKVSFSFLLFFFFFFLFSLFWFLFSLVLFFAFSHTLAGGNNTNGSANWSDTAHATAGEVPHDKPPPPRAQRQESQYQSPGHHSRVRIK